MNVLNRIYSVFLMTADIFCIGYLINSLFFTLGINEDVPSITRILSSSISFSIFWVFLFKNFKITKKIIQDLIIMLIFTVGAYFFINR
mgnify:CR=1 FL=1